MTGDYGTVSARVTIVSQTPEHVENCSRRSCGLRCSAAARTGDRSETTDDACVRTARRRYAAVNRRCEGGPRAVRQIAGAHPSDGEGKIKGRARIRHIAHPRATRRVPRHPRTGAPSGHIGPGDARRRMHRRPSGRAQWEPTKRPSSDPLRGVHRGGKRCTVRLVIMHLSRNRGTRKIIGIHLSMTD